MSGKENPVERSPSYLELVKQKTEENMAKIGRGLDAIEANLAQQQPMSDEKPEPDIADIVRRKRVEAGREMLQRVANYIEGKPVKLAMTDAEVLQATWPLWGLGMKKPTPDADAP